MEQTTKAIVLLSTLFAAYVQVHLATPGWGPLFGIGVGGFAVALLAGTPLKRAVDRIAFDRVKVYAAYPFQVSYADWFDRLSPPIRFYYDENDLQDWAAAAGLRDATISPTGKYGWRLQGHVAGRARASGL